jgi:hypothetical protein
MDDFNSIKKAVDSLLKINSTVKRKKKAHVEKQKDLFINIINALQASQVRSNILYNDLKLDYANYDELFYQIIDSLILLHFGNEGYELISFYLYEKFTPDGEMLEMYNDDEEIIPTETPEDIWNILSKLKSDNEK